MREESGPEARRVRRRGVVAGSAWAAPLVLSVAAAPAFALSCELTLVMLTDVLTGSTLVIRDSKNSNSNTNVDPLSNTTVSIANPVLNITFQVLGCQGAPVPDATVVVAGDSVKDAQGNFMIGFSNASQNSGFGQSTTQRISTQLTNALGQVRVKVSTATYGLRDSAAIPRSGTWSVLVSYPGSDDVTLTYNYTVVDGQPTV